MVSLQDLQYSLQLSQVANQIQVYYAYSIPWMTIACNLFALGVLFFRKRNGTGTGSSSGLNLVLLIFKWQYLTGLMYTLNMILNDNTFSQTLFNYVSTKYVEDYVCKIHLVLMKYFYCMAPWMQVIVTFDRLWSVIFANKWKLKRTRKAVTLLILSVQGAVLLINLFYLTYYASSSLSTKLQYDPVLKKTTWTNTTQLNCMVIDKNIQTVQDMLYVLMRIVLPLLIMATCSLILIKHVREAKRRVIVRGRNEKRENHFTVAVAFTNVAFLLFNLPVTVYYVIYYYVSYANVSFSLLASYQFNLFFVCAYLFSYMFTMAQFWIDLAFNRLFRNEVFAVFRLLFPRVFNRVGVSVTQNNSINNTK